MTQQLERMYPGFVPTCWIKSKYVMCVLGQWNIWKQWYVLYSWIKSKQPEDYIPVLTFK